MRPMTARQHFELSHRRLSDANEAMLELLYGPNQITDDELRKLIEKRPNVYSRFASYLGKRAQQC